MYSGLILSTLFLIILIFLGIILTFLINIFLIPIIMTPKKVLDEIVEIIVKNGNIKEQEKPVVYDLGSGDGKVLFALNEKFKNMKGIGIDISPILITISKVMKWIKVGTKANISFEVENIFNTSLVTTDIIYCNLNPQALEILEKKFKDELDQHAVVYSYQYEIPNKKGKKYELNNGKILWEYIY